MSKNPSQTPQSVVGSKSPLAVGLALLMPLALAGASGCASRKTQPENSASQPGSAPQAVSGADSSEIITSQKSVPDTINVDSFMQKQTSHQFLAEVRTPHVAESKVHLKVDGSPVEVEMKNVGGNLWRGTLNTQQIGQLARGGKIVQYQAHVVVDEPNGQTVVSKDPLKFSISAPSIEKRVG